MPDPVRKIETNYKKTSKYDCTRRVIITACALFTYIYFLIIYILPHIYDNLYAAVVASRPLLWDIECCLPISTQSLI